MDPTDRHTSSNTKEILRSLRDLSDFCVYWEKLRPCVSRQSLKNSELPESSIEVILWLVEHADRTTMLPSANE